MNLILNYYDDGKLKGFSFTQNEELLKEVCALLRDLKTLGERLMSQISDFATKVNSAFDQLGTAVNGLVVDVKTLNDLITQLQGSQGTITPEDQALLDGIQTRAQAIADKAKALDDQTAPPAVPQP